MLKIKPGIPKQGCNSCKENLMPQSQAVPGKGIRSSDAINNRLVSQLEFSCIRDGVKQGAQ